VNVIKNGYSRNVTMRLLRFKNEYLVEYEWAHLSTSHRHTYGGNKRCRPPLFQYTYMVEFLQKLIETKNIEANAFNITYHRSNQSTKRCKKYDKYMMHVRMTNNDQQNIPHKTKDSVTRMSLKPGVNSCDKSLCSE
jgi:hypothetical protein